MGAQTPFFYIFREREMIYDLEAATGQRMARRTACIAVLRLIFLGLEVKDFCNWFGPKIDEYEMLITNNPIFRRRIEGLGTITREQAINWSLSGPMLRPQVWPGICARLTTTSATTISIGRWQRPKRMLLARYRVRLQEMRESLKTRRRGSADSGGPTENLEAKRQLEGKDSEFYVRLSHWPRKLPHLQDPQRAALHPG